MTENKRFVKYDGNTIVDLKLVKSWIISNGNVELLLKILNNEKTSKKGICIMDFEDNKMTEDNRFVETISTGIVTDTVTGKEYDCEMRINDNLLNLMNNIAQENEQLNLNYNELRYANDIYCKKIDSLKKENEQLKKENEELEEENERLENKLWNCQNMR